MKSKIDKNSPLHLYLQLVDILRNQIAKLPDGHRFYADRETCRLFKVSQPTARLALSVLAKEGLIKRIPSRGTFVQKGNRGSVKKKNMAIGVISPLESYRPHALGIKGIENVASRYGYCTIFSDYHVDERSGAIGEDKKLPELIEKLKKRKVDGIIIISPVKKEEYKAPQCLQDINIPLVLINWSITEPPISAVVADYEDGTYRLVLHLADLGYKTIGFIGGPKNRKANLDRFNGYKKALAYRGLEYRPEFVCSENPDFSEVSGADAMSRILDLKELPRAIFAATDRLALGAVNAIKSKGLSVPKDVAVAGFDNSLICYHIKPTLTTVTQPYYELGTNAMGLLKDEIEGCGKGPIKVMVPCKVIIRDSSGLGKREGPDFLIKEEAVTMGYYK